MPQIVAVVATAKVEMVCDAFTGMSPKVAKYF